MSVALGRTVFGMTFQNPVLLAAGTAGFGRELDGIIDLDQLGGVVTKAVSIEPREGNPPPRVAEFSGGMLNSVGLANPGLAAVSAEALPWLVRRLDRARIIVNVVGFRVPEYAAVVSGLESVEGLNGYELNLSCPNTAAGGIEFGADPVSVAEIVSGCRTATRRFLIVKLSPVLPDVAAMAAAAEAAGADGISLVNTMPGSLDHSSGASRLGRPQGGVSGPALLPVGLAAVKRVRERLPEIPIVGVGGIRSADDVRSYLRAGASLVAIGTAQLADPRLPPRIIRDLEEHGG